MRTPGPDTEKRRGKKVNVERKSERLGPLCGFFVTEAARPVHAAAMEAVRDACVCVVCAGAGHFSLPSLRTMHKTNLPTVTSLARSLSGPCTPRDRADPIGWRAARGRS